MLKLPSSALAVVLLAAMVCGRSWAQNAPAAPPTPAAVAEISGIVVSRHTPLPGVLVSAAHSISGRKYVTSTQVDGSYALVLPAFGRYVVRADLAGFATVTREILLDTAAPKARANLEMALASRVPLAEAGRGLADTVAGNLGREIQNLVISGVDASAADPATGAANLPASSNPAMNPETATESVSLAGAMGRVNEAMAGGDPEAMQERLQEMRERAAREGRAGAAPGGDPVGGGAMGAGPMIMMGPGGAGRGMRGFKFNQPHGTLFYTLGDSAFDAAPYSLTGVPSAKPGYTQNRFGALVGGPLNLPHIYHGGSKTFFFVGWFGGRNTNPYDAFSTVPTLLERSGDFSATTVSAGRLAGTPVTIFDPATRQPFAGNRIPARRIDAAAAALLNSYPLPNQPGSAQNFHFVSAADNSSDTITGRIVHNFGPSSGPMMVGPFAGMGGGGGRVRHNLNAGFSYNRGDSDLLNPFPALGGSNRNRNLNVNGGYLFGRGRFNANLRLNYNRGYNLTRNRFTSDIESALGISGASSDPRDFGLPNLTFSHYSSLRDVSPSDNDQRSFTVSPSFRWSRGKHNLRWGADFRHNRFDLRTAGNARGAFIFTGFATAGPSPGSGYDLADFLLGLPQQTAIQFFSGAYHFRANSWNWFLQDDWRLLPSLTLNLGLRYEYQGPYHELSNRLVDLDPAAGFTAVAPVLPEQSGPFSGGYPRSLVKPDRNNYAPRLGIAWKPWSKTVVRAGYGINYNLGQYQYIVQQLALQPPFAFTETNLAGRSPPLTLENGFPPQVATVTNNFAVNRDYRLGYVQNWNLNLQRELPGRLLLNVGYQGAKGTRLDIQRAPNRGPLGLRIPGVQPFIFEDSIGNSILHSGTVRLRKRLHNGLSLGGSYSFSRSIDNASSIGGGAVVVAQNDQDLAAERGLSSFDQRHRFTGDFYYELPLGAGKPLLSGDRWYERALSNLQVSGSWTLGSGNPFTPRVLGDFSDVARGTNGTLRANYAGGPIAGPRSARQWFNTAVFTAPPPGTFGNAGRNIIAGPGPRQLDLSVAKAFPLEGVQRIEVRAMATNLLNTPQFTAVDTAVNSPSYGQVISVGSMRKMSVMARFQF